MNGTILEVEAQRSRWVRYRASEALTLEAGDGFANGGLAGNTDGLEARVLMLPSDPMGAAVSLDQAALAWLKEPRRSPYGGGELSWGSRERGTSSAIVLYDQYRDDAGWARYLALHRHGGVEAGSSHMAYAWQNVRIFALRPIVGLVWAVAARQAEAVERWGIQPPYELAVAIRHTAQATLGAFAEGWANPGQGLFEFKTCLENHLLLRLEIDNAIEPEPLALAIGDQLELAFGSVQRRHLARVGEYEGRFDPRF